MYIVIRVVYYLMESKREELARSKEELHLWSEELANRVEERTVDLEKANEELRKKTEELEKFNKFAVGRELKMVELKKRIKELEEKYGKIIAGKGE